MTIVWCARCGDSIDVDPDESQEELAIAKLKSPTTTDFVSLCERCYEDFMSYAWRHPEILVEPTSH